LNARHARSRRFEYGRVIVPELSDLDPPADPAWIIQFVTRAAVLAGWVVTEWRMVSHATEPSSPGVSRALYGILAAWLMLLLPLPFVGSRLWLRRIALAVGAAFVVFVLPMVGYLMFTRWLPYL
jgi:hypothetical protein